MRKLIFASAIALSVACPAAFADQFHVQGGASSATNGWSSGSIDGGGAAQYGGHQYTNSQSSGSGYATTTAGPSHGSTYTATTQQGSGFTTGTGAGGYDFAAGNYASGSSSANFTGGFTQHFNYGW